MIDAIKDRVKSHVVYHTQHMAVLQCDTSEQFVIQIYQEEINLHPCSFIAFRKKIKDINILSLLDSNMPDIEIISLPACNRIFLFNIHEVLELKDLLAGTIAMLELNSIIHKEIVRKSLYPTN